MEKYKMTICRVFTQLTWVKKLFLLDFYAKKKDLEVYRTFTHNNKYGNRK